MECKINDDLESVDKNYRQQLEKAYKSVMYLSARCFDTKKAKKRNQEYLWLHGGDERNS